ncbi:MAG: hypothetical protein LE168_03820 [Endomicrobium sp.]|nr:hypothetical protein [Endomicrobium sp.]
MRQTSEEVKDKKIELIDGVKVYTNGGRGLFVPDPDEALFHIWVES